MRPVRLIVGVALVVLAGFVTRAHETPIAFGLRDLATDMWVLLPFLTGFHLIATAFDRLGEE